MELQSIGVPVVNAELQKLDEWLRFSKVSSNYSKASYLLIGLKANRPHAF